LRRLGGVGREPLQHAHGFFGTLGHEPRGGGVVEHIDRAGGVHGVAALEGVGRHGVLGQVVGGVGQAEPGALQGRLHLDGAPVVVARGGAVAGVGLVLRQVQADQRMVLVGVIAQVLLQDARRIHEIAGLGIQGCVHERAALEARGALDIVVVGAHGRLGAHACRPARQGQRQQVAAEEGNGLAGGMVVGHVPAPV
jgi:hypothetical protein